MKIWYSARKCIAISHKKEEKKVLRRVQSAIQNEWAKNLSALDQLSFFKSAKLCHTVYMMGLRLTTSVFRKNHECMAWEYPALPSHVAFVCSRWSSDCIPLTFVLFCCAILMLKSYVLSRIALEKYVWTSVKVRKENQCSFKRKNVDVSMK